MNKFRINKYKEFFLQGDWHLHSDYVDGKDSIFDMVKEAGKKKLRLVAFTEHVRKSLTYNFSDYISDIFSARDKFDIEILVGVEAKVLDSSGSLDLPEEVIKEVDLILGVFHSFDSERYNYGEALINFLKSGNANIWGHPFAQSYESIINSPFKDFIKHIKSSNLVVEISLRYETFPENFFRLCIDNKVPFCIGSDAHSVDEIWDGKKPNFIKQKDWDAINEYLAFSI
jgi:histidinol phosphatase-like PHP family hydrolase